MVDVFGDKAREARLRCSGHQQTRDSEHISRWRRMIGAAEGNRRQTTAINNRPPLIDSSWYDFFYEELFV